jgi:tetratricopeptide (TPR) repeat protein
MSAPLRSILVIFILLIPAFCTAQQEKIDSVSALIKKDQQDTSKVNHLHELAHLYSRSNPDTSMAFCKEALALSERLNWPAGIGQSYFKMGVLYDAKGNYPSALEQYNKALKVWDSLEVIEKDKTALYIIKTRKARTLTNIGNDHGQGNSTNALRYAFAALKLANEIGNKHLEANNLGNIGGVFNKQKEFDKALTYLFQSLKIYEELNMNVGVAYCYIGIGNTYNDKKDIDKALEYYFKSLKINKETGNTSYIAASLGNIGNAYSRQERNDSALAYFFEALKIDEETQNYIGMAYRLSSIGSVYSKLKKNVDAEKYLLKGLALAENIGSLNLQKDDHQDLSDLYARQNDFKRSLEHFKKFSVVKDSLFNEEKSKELTRYELNYEFEKREAELKAEQEKKDAVALADKKRQKVLFWLISAIAIAISLIALIVFRSLRTTKKQKIIIEKQKELVEEKQREVLDSIHYAKRIQRSLLPTDKYIHKQFIRLKRKNG